MLFNEDGEAQEYLTMKKREVEKIEMTISSRQYVQDVVDMTVMKKLDAYLEKLEEHLSTKSRTPKLLIQYIEYVTITKQFIRAARSGDWNLNLTSLQKMLQHLVTSTTLNQHAILTTDDRFAKHTSMVSSEVFSRRASCHQDNR